MYSRQVKDCPVVHCRMARRIRSVDSGVKCVYPVILWQPDLHSPAVHQRDAGTLSPSLNGREQGQCVASDSKPNGPPEETDSFEQTLLYARDLARLRASRRSLRRRLNEADEPHAGRILVADDEPGLRLLLSITLGLEHYEIVEAKTGTEALDLTVQERPDLILLDVRMPNVNGIEVCRRIKADPDLRHIPIIMVSALAMPTDLESAREAGADRYLTKPFSPLELVEIVEGLLDRARD